MTKIVLILLLLFSVSCFSQEYPCSDGVLYDFAFKWMKLYERKAVVLEVGYKPDTPLLNMVQENDSLNFNSEEIKQLNKPFKKKDFSRCAKLKKRIELIVSNDAIKKDGSFTRYYFSQIISLSETKKCLFQNMSTGNIKYDGGKAIGHQLVFIFNLINEKWQLTDVKSVAMY